MDTIQEALDKCKEITEEIGDVWDSIVGFHAGKIIERPSREHLAELQKRFNDLHKQRLEIYQEINRLSNGRVRISKDGTKITFRNPK